jgi:hypothetical protein
MRFRGTAPRWVKTRLMCDVGRASARKRDLSTMTPGELLEPDLTDRTEFVWTYDRLPADECAEIQTREVLSASWAQ